MAKLVITDHLGGKLTMSYDSYTAAVAAMGREIEKDMEKFEGQLKDIGDDSYKMTAGPVTIYYQVLSGVEQ